MPGFPGKGPYRPRRFKGPPLASLLSTQTAAQLRRSVSLDRLFLHVVTKSSPASNAAGPVVALTNPPVNQLSRTAQSATHEFAGRAAPTKVFGQIVSARLQESVPIPYSQMGTLENLITILRAGSEGSVICARDQIGNRLFGRVANWQVAEYENYAQVNFEVQETEYTENISGDDPDPLVQNSFLPSDISGLELWLEADNISDVADGAAITTWPDSSGNGRDALQPNIANKPLLIKDWLNGRQVVRFDGSNDYMQTTSFTVQQPLFIFAVCRLASLSATQIIVDGIGASLRCGFEVLVGKSTFWSLVSGVNVVTVSSGVDTNWHILGGHFNGPIHIPNEATDTAFYLDNAAGIQIAVDTNALGGVTLGCDSTNLGAGSVMNGDIAEVGVYSGILSNRDRAKLMTYLNRKYAVF